MQQCMILLDGPMGSGKTTIAGLLHKTLKRTAWVSRDRIKWFASGFDRTKAENEAATAVVLAMIDAYARHDYSILVDQGFIKKGSIQPYLKLARKHRLPVFFYRLEAPRSVLLARLKGRPKPMAAKAKPSMSRTLSNLRAHRRNQHAGATVIDSGTRSPRQIANSIAKDIAAGRR